MHGVRRGSRPSGDETREQEELAAKQAALARRALSLRRAGDFSADALATVTLALTSNPDEYSLWAFRREALLHSLPPSPSETFAALWSAELDLAFRALKRHPKAYPAWQHRFWLLSSPALTTAIPPADRTRAFEAEFAMSAALLARDGRNFHGWAHRMRVRAAAGPGAAGGSSPEDELKFVTEKVSADFANYSAWHHRSALLPVVHAGKEGREDFVGAELEFVRGAFYTEPDVQSAWFYHRWLLAGAPARGRKAVVSDGVCESELKACQELLDIEPDARWAIHAKADLLVRLGRGGEAAVVYRQLMEIDPMRRGFYAFQLKKVSS